MKSKQVLRVVAVYPGDVEAEVQQLQEAILDVNRSLELAGWDILLELHNWKTDVPPGSDRAGSQQVIDRSLRIEQSHILIGIFGTRLGAAGPNGKSGTEHEIQQGFAAAEQSGKPRIMLYFNTTPYYSSSLNEHEQRGEILRLKTECQQLGALTADYQGADFKYKVRHHLETHVFENHHPTNRATGITASAVPVVVRAEGLTEAMGQVLLQIRGYTPGTYDIQLFLNIFVTNRLTSGNLSDAYLSIDGSSLNVAGEITSPNVVQFRNVPIPAHPTQLNVRITGVRAVANIFGPNAYVVGALAIKPSGSTAPSKLMPIEPPVILGFTKSGCAFRIWVSNWTPPPVHISSAVGVNASLLRNSGVQDASITMYLQFTELMPDFFKTAAEEGSSANCGTRFRVVFADVPNGVHLYVTTTEIHSPSGVASRVMFRSAPWESSAEPIGAITVPGMNIAVVSIPVDAGGIAVAEWEWVSQDPLSPENLEDILLGVMVASNPGEAALGKIGVGGCLAPISNVSTPAADDPIPRFRDTSRELAAICVEP